LQLDPNEVANLWFRVRNRAIHPLDSAYQVTGRLISLDTMVIVQDSIKPFPLCRRRDSTDNRAAQFRVYCRRGTNPNRVVPLRLELTYRDDTLTMMQPVAFTITIGANPIYVHDVGCTRLLAPAGTLDSGANVTPACSVYNYGDVVENYQVRMRIGSLYYRSVSVVGHLPGTATYVTFPNWNALPRGTLGVTCSTELAGDRIPANDQVSGSVTVRVRDVGCTRIIAPVDTIPFGTPVSPRAMVMNFGTVAATFTAKFTIGAFYRDSTTITNLAPGDSTAIAFAQWPADTAGKFAVRCSTRLPGDQVPVNDAAFDSVFVRLIDVSVMEIVVPRGGGMADSGAIVTPRCSVANYGNVRLDSLDVDLYIGPHYFCTGRARFWPPGGRGEVVFPKPCTLAGRGWWPMRCSTKLAGDQIPANDRKRDSVFLRVRDVAAVRVLSPLGVILPGPVIPSAEVHNYGNLREPCQVFFRINSSPAYLDSVALPNGLPFADTTLSFTSWNSSSGAYVACCSTGLTGDMIPANDTASARFVVGTVDVSVTAILAPVGWFDTSELQIPRAKAKNLGTAPVVNVKAIFAIDSTPGNRVYLDTVTFDLGAGAEVIATFDAWPKPYVPREYASSCYVVAPGDGNPANDTLTGRFVATSYPPGWQEMSPVPAGAKAVKDGGWLTYDAGTRLIYAARGNRRPDFLSYNPLTDSWKSLTPWPPGNEAKLPGKGSAGTADGRGHVYAVKGNNSLGFWRYDAESNTWTQLKNVPLGGGKKVKGGAGIVWAHKGETGSPYLLKGYKNEFYRYDVATDSWMTLPPAPAGARPKYDKGSWLAYDGLRTIYAHKAKFHEFYGYDLEEDAWSGPLTPMPMGGSAGAKKAKDGSCAAFAPLGLLYAFKGGNTREFWQCELAHDGQQWSEQEMIPEGAARKKVKAGASLAATGIELFALKGNKSNEFWRYVPGAQVSALPPRDGVTADQAALPEYRMLTTPNPLTSGLATVRFFVTPGAPAALRLYDAAGRYLQSAIYNRQSATLDLRSLPAGVYLLRLE
ncbi:T9SS type A sorting domain-containing protein, partial [candidate division WOR-3 bacterium]|nr:T9SS type A sorting domain-containing protein [candidate division WOR-3 bacterium]